MGSRKKEPSQSGGIDKPARSISKKVKVQCSAERPCATAADLRDEELVFLWHARIPFRSVTLLAGPSSQGKSTIASSIAALLSAGGSLPEGPTLEPRSVLWYGSEELVSVVVKPRLRAAGADLGRVYFPEFNPDGSARMRPRLPRDVEPLKKLARAVDAGLIVFDPIRSYIEESLPPDAGSTGRAVIESLSLVANAVNCAIVVIMHPRKSVGVGTPIEQVSGHREWTNAPRSVLMAYAHPEREHTSCVVCVKPSLAKAPPSILYRIEAKDGAPVIVWGEVANLTAEQIADGNVNAGDRDALAEAKMLLIDRLAAGEKRAKEMLRAGEDCGVSIGTLRKAKKLLGITSHTIGPPDDRYHVWRPPAVGFPKPPE